jgi:hypothetical protein
MVKGVFKQSCAPGLNRGNEPAGVAWVTRVEFGIPQTGVMTKLQAAG